MTGPDSVVVQETRQEIRALVQEIAQLAQSGVSSADFFRGFLSRVAAALASAGSAVWLAAPGGTLELTFQINLAASGIDATPDTKRQHAALLRKALAGGQPLLIPPQSGAAADEVANPTDHLLILAPLRLEQETVGVVEVFQRPGGGPATQRGYARFLAQMCDLATDYLKSQKLRELADRQELWQQLEGFLHAIHRSLDLRTTSYAIANEGRRLIGCDRLSLALGDASGARITTVSGLDSIDRRASEVRRLGLLARAVLRTGEPLWHTGDDGELPPQIDDQLQPYLDQSHARMIAVLPLFPPGKEGVSETLRRRPLGALIVEQLGDSRISPSIRSRASTVAQHSAAALAHALEHHNLPLLPLWRLVGRLTWFLRGRAMPWTMVCLALVAVGVLALATVRADFDIAASGKLQPALRRDVFARIDGDVINVPVSHGQMVQTGDLLVELANNDLAEELQRLVGRQKTNQEQLSATNKRLLDSARGSGSRLTPADEAKLAGELLELKQESENIRRELEVFSQKQSRLKVIADQPGQVVTWKVQEQLQRRPVIRGQVLMTLANPDGPWELELYVPERRLKHLMQIQEQPPQHGQRPPLDVIFALASHPGAEFHGEVIEIEQTAEVRGEEGNTILVRALVNKDELPHLHDQTTVTARLYCGRRSIGFVWFCDLIETVQSKILFWL
ncbi:MAG TPA: efflux RND transporter periplasmic adaptor subunit [Pirellulaceae bacterium]|nr:efflux RND transporter periplasmic adaptor subunit [Pirellulaceae bacterium]